MAKIEGFKPFIASETKMAEFTIKSIVTGAVFGIIFGAATVYLALKAGLNCFCFYPHCRNCHYAGAKVFTHYYS